MSWTEIVYIFIVLCLIICGAYVIVHRALANGAAIAQ